jgi:hypothetical protein
MNAEVPHDAVQRSVYLERGQPVEVLTRWGPGGGPRNVLIRRETGQLVVRPFRGLRRSVQDRSYQPIDLRPGAAHLRSEEDG